MMDYVVAHQHQMQAAAAAGHTTYNATAVAPAAAAAVPQPQPHSIADHRPPPPVPVSQRTRRGISLSLKPSPSPSPSSTTTMIQQERREALEQEVSELKQQLSNEQTVHQILERALQPSSERSYSSPSSSVAVPFVLNNIIPTKAKELLAELLLVEEEIARLEAQIQMMKQQGRGGGGGGSGSGSGGGEEGSSATTVTTAMQQQQQQHAPPPNPDGRRSPRPSSAADHYCKSMFFISQAMDGESYLLSKSKANKSQGEDDRRSDMTMMSPKNNIILGGAGAGAGAGAGLPLPPRHSLDKSNKQQQRSSVGPHVVVHTKKQQQQQHELPISKSPLTAKSHTRDAHHHQQQPPNKLSERIVKCLVCIFIRLLRSSRVAELDSSKSPSGSGTGSGNNNHLAAIKTNRGSFRIIDTGGGGGGGGLINDKERGQGQQDHYGIFDIQDAIVRDVGPYKNLVRFTSSSLDLISRGFSASPLLTKLRGMLEALQQVDLRALHNHQQKLAFWLNIYNTCIMHGILQHGLPSNSDKLLALKNKATINVSGQTFNALVIENFILRQPSSVKQEFWKCDVDVEEQVVREVYGLKTSEPNILFALCCGIRSSPALRIYKADRVVMELEKAKLEYLQASLVVTSTRRLMIPSLIHSNMHDFAKDMETLVRWICEQLPTSWSLRKSMVDCLRNGTGIGTGMHIHIPIAIHGGASAAAAVASNNNSISSKTMVEEVVDVIPLDYQFQYLLPMS